MAGTSHTGYLQWESTGCLFLFPGSPFCPNKFGSDCFGVGKWERREMKGLEFFCLLFCFALLVCFSFCFVGFFFPLQLASSWNSISHWGPGRCWKCGWYFCGFSSTIPAGAHSCNSYDSDLVPCSKCYCLIRLPPSPCVSSDLVPQTPAIGNQMPSPEDWMNLQHGTPGKLFFLEWAPRTLCHETLGQFPYLSVLVYYLGSPKLPVECMLSVTAYLKSHCNTLKEIIQERDT